MVDTILLNMAGVSVDEVAIAVPVVDDHQRYDLLNALYEGFHDVRRQLTALDVCAQTVSSVLAHPETATGDEKILLLFLEYTAKRAQKQMDDLLKKIPKVR